MISNQILQGTIDKVKEISKVELAVTDFSGRIVVSTMKEKANFEKDVTEFYGVEAKETVKNGCSFFKVYDEQLPEYVLVIAGSGENVNLIGRMAVYQLQSLILAYKERFDKDNFIKNLLLDNLLLVDIYSRAKKLHMQIDASRIVYVVETNSGKDSNALELVKEFVGTTGNHEIVTVVDENNVIIVRDLEGEQNHTTLTNYATALIAHLNKTKAMEVKVAYGTVVSEIKDVSRSYKEAKIALDVGKIFFTEQDVIAYNELGIGRLIYQLPLPLCQMFIQEIFSEQNPEEFDEETLTTIHKFFENSLNVSETSRQLFIHRNTLVYRLDKLQKSTGLDLRVFEDAITLKIALMVVDYMKYMEKHQY